MTLFYNPEQLRVGYGKGAGGNRAILQIFPGALSMMGNRSLPMDTLLAHVMYRDLEKAMAWLTQVFGFEEHYRYGQPISGAQMRLAKAWIMVKRADPECRTPKELGYGTQSLTIFIEDVDAHFEKAKARGATILEDPHETVYGEWQFAAEDLEGHHWLFSRHARDLSPEAWGAKLARPAQQSDSAAEVKATESSGAAGMVAIRRAEARDCEAIGELGHRLWPDASAAEHTREVTTVVAGEAAGNLPVVIFVGEEAGGHIVAFLEAGLRSHADGCDVRHPVGFIEGWYVAPEYRRHRIGGKLVAMAEAWARDQGCSEMASDTWLDGAESQHAHEALGYEVVDRCIHYRKSLGA